MSLKFIPTSHISSQSIREIETAILDAPTTPDIIAVELDQQRLRALFEEKRGGIDFRLIRKVGLTGFLFVLIGRFVQEKLGKYVGVSPGSEMKRAVELAREKQLKIALIDQPIDITLKRFSKQLSFKEKCRIAYDLSIGLLFRKRQMKQFGLESLDLSTVPQQEVISVLIKALKTRYPNIYKVLVDERNHYMVRKILLLQKKFPDAQILVVIGAGHLEGMIEILRAKQKKQEKKKVVE